MKYACILFLLASLCPWASSQKVGHINFGNLLEDLPQVKAADVKLTAYQDSLSKAFEYRVKAHRARIDQNKQKYDAGELTKIEADQINKSLNDEQNTLINDQKRAEATIMIRRQGYLQPIIMDVNDAIAKYGKENGYMFIFDESSGLLLFDLPSDDLTETIKKIVAR